MQDSINNLNDDLNNSQATAGKGAFNFGSLATFDQFAAESRDDPRAKPLSGKRLEALVDKLKEKEPWLTTTKAILTSADRLDGTSVVTMDNYYTSVDTLRERYPQLDL